MKKYGLKIGIFIILAVVLTLSLLLFNVGFNTKKAKAETADEYYTVQFDFTHISYRTSYFINLDELNTLYYYNETKHVLTVTFNRIYIWQGTSQSEERQMVFYNGDAIVARNTYMRYSTYYVTRDNVIAFTLNGYNTNNLPKEYFFKSIGTVLNISSQSNFSDWWNSTPQDIQTFITDGIGYWNTYDTNTNNGQDQANNPPTSFNDVDKGYSGWEFYINALLDNYDLQLQNARNTIEQQQATIEQQNAQLNELAPYMALDIVEGLFTSLGSLFNITIGPIPLYVFLLIPIILMIIYLIFKLMR